jgi:hypothetical protein
MVTGAAGATDLLGGDDADRRGSARDGHYEKHGERGAGASRRAGRVRSAWASVEGRRSEAASAGAVAPARAERLPVDRRRSWPAGLELVRCAALQTGLVLVRRAPQAVLAALLMTQPIALPPLGWLAEPHGLSRCDGGYSLAARVVGQSAGPLELDLLSREERLRHSSPSFRVGPHRPFPRSEPRWSEFPPSSHAVCCTGFSWDRKPGNGEARSGLRYTRGSRIYPARTAGRAHDCHPDAASSFSSAPRRRSFLIGR